MVTNINSRADFTPALNNIDIIVHCAARVHVMNNSLEVYREVNTHGTANLARQAAQAGAKRFIFISS
ncbi:NAD-dependent epimerase/dehydratase family protein, partial [Vibrio anguillarum]|nr:NAD-dependent epimerase/dehydratase family protein [Vibrio anguillarum]